MELVMLVTTGVAAVFLLAGFVGGSMLGYVLGTQKDSRVSILFADGDDGDDDDDGDSPFYVPETPATSYRDN